MTDRVGRFDGRVGIAATDVAGVLLQALEHGPDPFVLVSVDGRIVFANAAARYWGAIEGLDVDHALGPEHPGLTALVQQVDRDHREAQGRLRGLQAGGPAQVVDVRAVPVAAGLIGLWVRDATAEHAAAERAQAERRVLLQEIHHRVKNDLQLVVSLLRLGRQRLDDEGLRRVLDGCALRTEAIALVHECLYQGGRVDRIDTAAYLGAVVGRLSGALPAPVPPIALHVQSIDIDVHTAIPLGLIVQAGFEGALGDAGLAASWRGSVVLRAKGPALELTLRSSGDLVAAELDRDPIVQALVAQVRGVLQRDDTGGVTLRCPTPFDPEPS